jgi:RimJ/RimL family protein N-acetyltransferase
VQLRDVTPDDVDAYVRMRCDPVMMADLGGPLPLEGMADEVRRDAQRAAADLAWFKMIVPDLAGPDVVAGTVTIWSHDTDDGPISEIGWMVLPAFQGQELGRRAVRALLERSCPFLWCRRSIVGRVGGVGECGGAFGALGGVDPVHAALG